MTQKGNSPDWFSRIISVLSLILATSSISFSIWQYHNGITEFVNVSIEPFLGYGQLELTDINFGPDEYVVQIPWQLILSNTGSRKISVTDYKVLELVQNSKTGEIGPRFYSGIQGPLFDSSNKPVDEWH